MIETHSSQTLIEAQRRAHQQRAEAFAALWRSIPRIASNLRHRNP